MSEHPDIPELPAEPGGAELPEPTRADRGEEGLRADPRLRPPDPAGTRPEWDPATLLPKQPPPAATGGLWAARDATEAVGAEASGDREALRAGATAGVAAAAAADGSDGSEHSRFSPRFQFALGALMAVAAAAVVLFVAVLAGRGDSGSTVVRTGPTWSAWHPSSPENGPSEIADHVGRQYRLPDGRQLVAVTGGPLQIAGLPVTIAIRQTAAQGGNINLIDGTGVLYRMCGLGPHCKIIEGKPSVARMMLLRREALELALYSFRYLGVSDATVFLPLAKGEKNPSHALFFRRGDADLQGPVSQPLDATLAPQTPSVSSVNRSPDAQLVASITNSKLFQVSFTQANQDARAFMVLDPQP